MAAPDTGNEDLARKVAAAWAEVEAVEKHAATVAIQGIYEAETDTPEVRSEVEKADEFFYRIVKGES